MRGVLENFWRLNLKKKLQNFQLQGIFKSYGGAMASLHGLRLHLSKIHENREFGYRMGDVYFFF